MGSKKGKGSKKSPATKAANGAAAAAAAAAAQGGGADSALHGDTLKMIQVLHDSLDFVVILCATFVSCWGVGLTGWRERKEDRVA